jgi:hypothetical protein
MGVPDSGSKLRGCGNKVDIDLVYSMVMSSKSNFSYKKGLEDFIIEAR